MSAEVSSNRGAPARPSLHPGLRPGTTSRPATSSRARAAEAFIRTACGPSDRIALVRRSRAGTATRVHGGPHPRPPPSWRRSAAPRAQRDDRRSASSRSRKPTSPPPATMPRHRRIVARQTGDLTADVAPRHVATTAVRRSIGRRARMPKTPRVTRVILVENARTFVAADGRRLATVRCSASPISSRSTAPSRAASRSSSSPRVSASRT